MLLRTTSICLLFAAGAGSFSAREPRQIRENGGAFVGSMGCKSSSCHGGAGPKRSQYITWKQKDFHAKAYAILLDARSTRMAEALGLSDAPTSARCTVCHSPFQAVAPNRIARGARPDEGVSCESCHGAAGDWLRGHTRSDWTYDTRVSAGMRDLRNIYVRANACIACHQNLAPDLLDAGHPDLFFELDGQSVAEPKHWAESEPWNGLREWLTGQAVALREMSWALSNDPKKDERSSARWNGLAWLCATTTSAVSIPSPVSQPSNTPGSSDFASMQSQADALARRASVFNWNEGSARAMLIALASAGAQFLEKGTANNLLAQRAKRLVLALDRLANALNQNRREKLKIDAEIDQLFRDVRTLDTFEASGFAAHLRSLRDALDKSG